jgi:hypothetical protein
VADIGRNSSDPFESLEVHVEAKDDLRETRHQS